MDRYESRKGKSNMKIITQLCFEGQADEAIELYKEAFGFTVKSLIHYEDAVKFGWEEPNDLKCKQVYHSELVRDETELRVTDLAGKEQAELTRRIQVNVQFETEEEVEKAFQILTKDGEIVRNLVKPPYMVMIGEAKDKFGVHWVLMCDFH